MQLLEAYDPSPRGYREIRKYKIRGKKTPDKLRASYQSIRS